jgi:hypothetical protein
VAKAADSPEDLENNGSVLTDGGAHHVAVKK